MAEPPGSSKTILTTLCLFVNEHQPYSPFPEGLFAEQLLDHPILCLDCPLGTVKYFFSHF